MVGSPVRVSISRAGAASGTNIAVRTVMSMSGVTTSPRTVTVAGPRLHPGTSPKARGASGVVGEPHGVATTQ